MDKQSEIERKKKKYFNKVGEKLNMVLGAVEYTRVWLY